MKRAARRRALRALIRAALVMASLAAAGRGAAVVGPSADGAALAPGAIMILTRSGSAAGYCSGVVAAPGAVLTAAHCVPPGAALKVFFRDAAGGPVLLDVAEVERHPDYRADAIRKRERSIDLALVRLPAPLPERFRPATLGGVRAATAPGTRFRVAGYGLGREGEAATSGTFRVATLAARAPLSGVLLWAEDPEGRGAGACTGDSGGPVFAGDGDAVVAVTVWSAGKEKARCGALTQAVWIEPQRAWIDGVLARWRDR